MRHTVGILLGAVALTAGVIGCGGDATPSPADAAAAEAVASAEGGRSEAEGQAPSDAGLRDASDAALSSVSDADGEDAGWQPNPACYHDASTAAPTPRGECCNTQDDCEPLLGQPLVSCCLVHECMYCGLM